MSTTQLRNMAAGEAAKAESREVVPFPTMLTRFANEIKRALPKHLDADTMCRIALTAFRQNPKLAECVPASIFACVVQASQLGLRPGLLGECYLIPFWNNKKRIYECQMQVGYQGLLELVRRSGLVESIGCYLVHEADHYDVVFGTDPRIEHKPELLKPRGDVLFGYAVAKIKGGGVHVEVMTKEEIEAIRARSQNVQAAKKLGFTTPWDTDWSEMARKTLARRICKWLPKSPEIATALALENTADAGTQSVSLQEAMDGTWAPPVYDADTGAQATDAQVDAARSPAPAASTTPPALEQHQPVTFDFAGALDKVRACKDPVTLDLMFDELRDAPASEQQRAELGQVYEERAKALQQPSNTKEQKK